MHQAHKSEPAHCCTTREHYQTTTVVGNTQSKKVTNQVLMCSAISVKLEPFAVCTTRMDIVLTDLSRVKALMPADSVPDKLLDAKLRDLSKLQGQHKP